MGSRFNSTNVYTYTRADGVLITVNGRRRMLVTTSNNFWTVTGSDRIDSVAYATYADPTDYWAITDQDLGLDPFQTLDDSVVGTSILLPDITEINEYEG